MNEKILIVDDECDVVDMLKSYFEMQNFFVPTARDGETAIRQAAHDPTLVLLDFYRLKLKEPLTILENAAARQ